MTHDDAQVRLALLVVDELPADEQAALTAHLADCADCRAELADLRAAFGLLGEGVLAGDEPVLAPARVARIVRATAAEPKLRAVRRLPSWPWQRWVQLAAVVAVVSWLAGALLLPTLFQAKEEAAAAAPAAGWRTQSWAEGSAAPAAGEAAGDRWSGMKEALDDAGGELADLEAPADELYARADQPAPVVTGPHGATEDYRRSSRVEAKKRSESATDLAPASRDYIAALPEPKAPATTAPPAPSMTPPPPAPPMPAKGGEGAHRGKLADHEPRYREQTKGEKLAFPDSFTEPEITTSSGGQVSVTPSTPEFAEDATAQTGTAPVFGTAYHLEFEKRAPADIHDWEKSASGQSAPGSSQEADEDTADGGYVVAGKPAGDGTVVFGFDARGPGSGLGGGLGGSGQIDNLGAVLEDRDTNARQGGQLDVSGPVGGAFKPDSSTFTVTNGAAHQREAVEQRVPELSSLDTIGRLGVPGGAVSGVMPKPAEAERLGDDLVVLERHARAPAPGPANEELAEQLKDAAEAPAGIGQALQLAGGQQPSTDRARQIAVLNEKGEVLRREGRLEEARESFEQALIKDPYDTAATKGLKKIYDQLRADPQAQRDALVAERHAGIDWKWVDPAPPIQPLTAPQATLSDEATQKKLKDIVVPNVEFERATGATVAQFFAERSRELDRDRTGVSVVYLGNEADRNRRYDVDLDNVPLGEALRFLNSAYGDQVAVGDGVVAISPPVTDGETRFYRMPDLFGGKPARDVLRQRGVALDASTRLAYDAATGKLIVSGPKVTLDRLDRVLRDAGSEPPEQGLPMPHHPKGTDDIRKKLEGIVIPNVEFDEALLSTVASFVMERSQELDLDGEGVNLQILDGKAVAVTMDMDNVPLGELLRYVAQGTGRELVVEPYWAIVRSRRAPPAEAPAPEVQAEPALPPIPSGPPPPVNPFVMTASDRFSTFAIEADTASYSIARRFLAQGYRPPPALVRMEEFVNAFDYHYPRPAEGQTFAVYGAAAPAPFGQGLTLVRIGVQGQVLGREGRKPAHLVFVIDASGSMAQADRLPLVKKALGMLLTQLGPQDKVSIVTYAMEARLVADAVPVADAAGIAAQLDRIEPGSATNLLAGLQLGYGLARRHYQAGWINRVILCSDGVANIGPADTEELLANIARDRQQGITFTSVGVGSGAYDDTLLEQLANRGDGNYVFLDSEAQAKRVFVDELGATLQTIARNVKIQVEFDPTRVRRYRLIGYENRDVADKDFRNDAVDAGEIGSGQAATALYEVELIGEPTADLGTVYIRWLEVDNDTAHEFASRLRSDAIQERTPERDPRFALAAGVAELAELLRESEHARDGSLREVEVYLRRVAQQLPLEARIRELTELAHQAQGLPVAR